MTNTKKEILTQGAGIAGAIGVGVTGCYATTWLAVLAYLSGHKVIGTTVMLTGSLITSKKCCDTYEGLSKAVAELVGLDYWWLLNDNDRDEEVNVETESTEEETEEC